MYRLRQTAPGESSSQQQQWLKTRPDVDMENWQSTIQWQWCRVAIICRTFGFFSALYFVITLEAPLDMEQEAG